jgi:predicted RNA polymerase sigma factor
LGPGDALSISGRGCVVRAKRKIRNARIPYATAKHAKDTDWRRIDDLYALVARLNPSPVVELNRFDEARAAYEEALALAPTEVEGRFLTNRINDLG